MWTRACRLGIVRQVRCLQRGHVVCGEIQSFDVKESPSNFENRDVNSEKMTQFQLLNRGKLLLEQNKLGEFKALLLRNFERNGGLAKNMDNFIWLFLCEYYHGLNKPMDVGEMFDLYFELTEPNLQMIEYNMCYQRGKPNKRKFHPCVMFNLLNLAYDDYAREQKELADKLEHKPEIFETLKQASNKHIYQKILRTIGEHDALKKQRLHGAVLLANDQGIAFCEMLQAVEEKERGHLIMYLIDVAAAAKEPRILQPLVELQNFLPDNPALHSRIYNELALLYGQERNMERLERLWQRIAMSRETTENLHQFKHPIHRIRHFYRMANKKLPPDFVQLLERLRRLAL